MQVRLKRKQVRLKEKYFSARRATIFHQTWSIKITSVFLDFTPQKKILFDFSLNHGILSIFCPPKKKKWRLIEDSRKNREKWEKIFFHQSSNGKIFLTSQKYFSVRRWKNIFDNLYKCLKSHDLTRNQIKFFCGVKS